ncbi:YkgJ family cysteine cluster protein [Lutibacter aestuarii]|uniref:YkgJ family cysteine cluster protein n=1 Tax=Lutibacter aestuarii TaxID=861111 RepID=A0ABW2Z2K4_9FLAO|nr:YkgJ family cysteine cluster protein [uncultured Lutibacter sp.]
MSIERKVRLIEQMFGCLEQEITTFKKQFDMQCVSGCGKCCTKLDVEASPLEFLPWAFYLFLNDKAEEVLRELNHKSTTICHIYQPLSLTDSSSGSCGEYRYRGLICRLFGYAAVKDKYGQLRLATCKILKESQPQNYQQVIDALKNKASIPVFTDYYMQLSQIDFTLGATILPINKALIRAIEEVLSYYAYRPIPRRFKKIA